MAESLDDLRQPQKEPVDADERAPEEACKTPHADIAGYAPHRHMRVAAALLAFRLKRAFEPLLLFGREPVGIGRALLHRLQRDETEQDGGHAFADEHPLPAREAEQAVGIGHERRRDGTAQYRRERARDDIAAHRARPVALGKPLRQIDGHARQKARFHDAEQKAHGIEARVVEDEGRRRRDRAPRDENARDPSSRADAMQEQIARHFEEHVAHEEHAAREAEYGGAEVERVIHVERCEADVDAIEIVEEHHREEQGHEAAVHLVHRRGCGRGLDLGSRRACHRRLHAPASWPTSFDGCLITVR